jgi:hypothetical protein
MLAEWKLVNLVDKNKSAAPVASVSTIKIVPHKEKVEWKLEAKYNIGSAKKKDSSTTKE